MSTITPNDTLNERCQQCKALAELCNGHPVPDYVRGAYNSMAPYHQWHRVRRREDHSHQHGTATTSCGISYAYPSQYNTFADADTVALTGGDRCTKGCLVPAYVG